MYSGGDIVGLSLCKVILKNKRFIYLIYYSKKKIPLKITGISCKNVQTQAEKFLKWFGIRYPPPLMLHGFCIYTFCVLLTLYFVFYVFYLVEFLKMFFLFFLFTYLYCCTLSVSTLNNLNDSFSQPS